MPRSPSPAHLLAGAARWPFGLFVTSFAYVWRTTPIHRRELEGSWEEDRPPELPPGADQREVQPVPEGSGAYLRRRYRIAVRDPQADAVAVMAEIKENPNVVVPKALAHFAKTKGPDGRMEAGDEHTVRMPGPWDGPVRVVEVTRASFRFITLEGHIEAGQIEWRARDEDGRLVFEIESWSRPGDLASDVMHHRLRMAKEVQLHMWTSVLEKVVKKFGGRRDGPLDIETRVVAAEAVR